MPKELTREELFNLVWDRPMTKVAADYGISDVALRKICEKHRIPVPGRGYWAKQAAGKKVRRAHFRAITDPGLGRIFIYGSATRHLPEPVKVAKETARAREQKPENRVEVDAAPGSLHSRVARTAKRLEKAKPSERGLVATSGPDLFDVEIGPKSVSRVTVFLDALVKAAAARGYSVVKGNQALVFFVDQEPLDFQIVEQTTRSRHKATEAERAIIERWEKRQQRRIRSWDYADWTPRPDPPEWDYAPNGRLRVMINAGTYGYEGLRRTFGDGSTQRIETLINAILEAFATWSAAIKAKRIEDERREREREQAERRREELRRRNALEKKRIEALSGMLERWHTRQQVLNFISAVEERLDDNDREKAEAVREWVSWAREYAARLDPLSDTLPKLLKFEDFASWELR